MQEFRHHEYHAREVMLYHDWSFVITYHTQFGCSTVFLPPSRTVFCDKSITTKSSVRDSPAFHMDTGFVKDSFRTEIGEHAERPIKDLSSMAWCKQALHSFTHSSKHCYLHSNQPSSCTRPIIPTLIKAKWVNKQSLVGDPPMCWFTQQASIPKKLEHWISAFSGWSRLVLITRPSGGSFSTILRPRDTNLIIFTTWAIKTQSFTTTTQSWISYKSG